MNRTTFLAAAVLAATLLGADLRPLIEAAAERGSLRESLSLDGPWEILFDPQNQGRAAGWHRAEAFAKAPGRREIAVPSCWETVEKDYEGVAFYRRTFTVPAAWKGRVVRLRFGAVNFRAEVWLNDTAVGAHEGGFTPFEFRVDDLLRFGEENVLTLRVAGPILMTEKTIEGVGKMETPQWRGAIAGGIWQPVRLIATGPAVVDDVFIEPRLADDTATFHVTLTHTGDQAVAAQVAVTVRPADRPNETAAAVTKTLDLAPGPNRRTWTLRIPDARRWSPEHPHLYRAEVRVTCGGRVSDRWHARFGMREFTVRDDRFCLNGEPMYLKATFFEGLYPRRLAYPDSEAMARREIRLAKEAGFNMIRPWRKPPPPMWLDLADEMGVLTVGSLAIQCMGFPRESARLPGWVANEVRESIRRDRNRACVVQWELFNELKRPVLKRLLHPMAMLARDLDPTRLILDESGGWAQGANLFLPYASEATKFNDIHHYPGPQINEAVYTKLLLTGRKSHDELRKMGLAGRLPGHNVVPGLMTFVSELGYGSLPDLVENNRRFAEDGNPIVPPTVYHRRLAEQHRRALKESGLDAVYPDLKRFCLDQQVIHGRANKRMIEAVRCNPAVKGYCIHALVAGDWIIGAGLLDLFRSPKTRAYTDTQAANRPRILSIRVRPRNAYAERGTRVEVTGVNELEAVKGTLTVEVAGPDGAVVFAKTAEADLPAGIAPLFAEALDTKALKGTYTVTAKVMAGDGSPVAASAYPFDVFAAEQLAVPENRIAVLDPTRSLTPFLKRRGIAFEEFGAGTDRSVPVFVGRTVAHNPAQRKRFDDLAAFIKAGGTGVYLQAGGPRVPWGRAGKALPVLPVEARVKRAAGLWTCIPHIVTDHPVFRGLPAGGMMGPVYENVWADSTLLDAGGEVIVGTVAFDHFPDFDRSRRHYYGPGDTWWGADLATVRLGKGRLVASQLRLVEHLGKDPVADKILYNLIRYAGGLAKSPE